MRIRCAQSSLVVLCAFASPIAAQCRTPIPGPATPGPATPTPAPTSVLTAPRSVQVSPDSWDMWWALHKFEFLGRTRPSLQAPKTGKPRDTAPQPEDPELVRLRDEVVRPALLRALRDGAEIMAPQVLIALGRLGTPADAAPLQREAVAHLGSSDAQTRELAALAMGLGGWPGAAETLGHLYRDDREGRKLCGKSRVARRARAFAGYGLGLLAQSTDDFATKTLAFEALSSQLAAPLPDRNVASAGTTSVGMLALDAGSETSHKRLAWRGSAALRAFAELKSGPGDQIAQAHALLATARD